MIIIGFGNKDKMSKLVYIKMHLYINIALLVLFIVSFFCGIAIFNYIVFAALLVLYTIYFCSFIAKRKSGKDKFIIQEKDEDLTGFNGRKKLRDLELKVWSFGNNDIPKNKLLNVFSFFALGLAVFVIVFLTENNIAVANFSFQLIDEMFVSENVDVCEYLIRVSQRVFPLLFSFFISKIILNLAWYLYSIKTE